MCGAIHLPTTQHLEQCGLKYERHVVEIDIESAVVFHEV